MNTTKGQCRSGKARISVMDPRFSGMHSQSLYLDACIASRCCCAVVQTLNNALLENNCSENASRMSAMESSTKNAKEMLDKLTLSYNRYTAGPQTCTLAHQFSTESLRSLPVDMASKKICNRKNLCNLQMYMLT